MYKCRLIFLKQLKGYNLQNWQKQRKALGVWVVSPFKLARHIWKYKPMKKFRSVCTVIYIDFKMQHLISHSDTHDYSRIRLLILGQQLLFLLFSLLIIFSTKIRISKRKTLVIFINDYFQYKNTNFKAKDVSFLS